MDYPFLGTGTSFQWEPYIKKLTMLRKMVIGDSGINQITATNCSELEIFLPFEMVASSSGSFRAGCVKLCCHKYSL